MKKSLLTLSVIALLFSCDKENGYVDKEPVGYGGIISTETTNLSKIVFTLDLIYEDSLYLLADSLFGLEIYLNNRSWGYFTSTTIDTTGFNSQLVNGSHVTNDPVEYLFITNDQSSIDSLNTAGEYAIALRNLLSLQPGDYIAEIRYVSWVNTVGDTLRKPVRDLIPFTLEAGTNSLYIGQFSSRIKL